MNILKTLTLAASISLSLSSFAVHADAYNFSYTFTDNSVLTGSLSGTLIGSLINDISNVHVNFNGNDFSGAKLFSAAWNTTTENWDNTTAAVISTNGALNNFIIADTNVPSDLNTSNYFFFVNDPNGIGREVFATNLNSGDIAYETPANASWTLSAITAPVPEPGIYAMLLAGLAFLFAYARRRQG